MACLLAVDVHWCSVPCDVDMCSASCFESLPSVAHKPVILRISVDQLVLDWPAWVRQTQPHVG